MRIAILQYPILWANVAENLRLTQQRIRSLRGQADVALLPEMFTTGFCTDRPELAETVDGVTMQTMQSLSDETGIAIAGTFICEDGDKLFNRGFFVRPFAQTTFTDKRHLYAHGGEDRFFSPATERIIIEYRGVKMLMLICYDLRFPIWARNVSGYDYDILLVSANWPQIRIQYWDALIAARATENQCYIAAANPVGDDGLGLHYNGHSIAYDTHLHPICAFADNEQGTRIADFDIQRLHHFREALPLWRDVDREWRIEN